MNRAKLTEQLIAHEGLRLKPYRCTAGKLTIGVGRNIEDRGITRAEALMLLSHDIEIVEEELDKHAPWWRTLDDVRQRVLVDMAFNMGWPALSGFKRMLAALEAKDFRIAADEMLASKWARQVKGRATKLAQMMRHGTEV